MNGGTEQVQAQLSDKELLNQFREVELMEEKDKSIIYIIRMMHFNFRLIIIPEVFTKKL